MEALRQAGDSEYEALQIKCVQLEKEITVFMLIERMIQLPQENSIPGIFCILLERKRLSVIIFYESN